MESPKQSSTLRGSINNDVHLGETATELLEEGKKMANNLYKQGRHKIDEAQQNVKEYSDEMLRHVQEKPMASLLIAGAIGFLLSSIFRR